jgi:hypothetical protein
VVARLCLDVSSAELLRRIRAEYLEMPGLRLTGPRPSACSVSIARHGTQPLPRFWTRSSFPAPTTACSRWQHYRLNDGPDFRNRRRQERDELWMIS